MKFKGNKLKPIGILVTLSFFISAPVWTAVPKLVTGRCEQIGTDWKTVSLPYSYDSMVIVTSPIYKQELPPAVVRIKERTSNSFQIRMQMPGSNRKPNAFAEPIHNPYLGRNDDWRYNVHYMVVEEGVYTRDIHGINMEAGIVSCERVNHSSNWQAQEHQLSNRYAQPVVVGQVQSFNDPRWSAFWANIPHLDEQRMTSKVEFGLNVAEDLDKKRKTEEIGYVVIEEGEGTIGNFRYVAKLGPITIRGFHSRENHNAYTLDLDFAPETPIVSSASMRGGNGGWAVLNGETNGPVDKSTLKACIMEDQIRDSETGHTTEKLSYIIFKELKLELITSTPDLQLL
jgi:hypothetical protein